MVTYTPNLGLAKPLIDGDDDVWGDLLNANADVLDAAFGAAPGGGASVTVDVTPPATPDAGDLWWDSTGGQLYVRYDDGTSQQWVTAANMEGLANAATKQDVAATQNNVGRNLLHNSLFNIAQRGAGPWTTPGFTMDRWGMNFVGGSYSIFQGPLNDAFRAQIGDEAAQFYMSGTFVGGGAAGDFTVVSQSIEGVRRLAGKTVTISFWAIASANGMKLGIGGWQEFGTGGSPSVGGYIPAIPVTLTTGFARYSVTLTVPSASGKTVGTNGTHYTQLIFWSSCGATNNANAGGIGVQSGGISIWGVQLEIGSTATPLEKPDPQIDLANCQRFYQSAYFSSQLYQVAGLYVGAWTPFPVQMRVVPTIGFSGVTYNNGSGIAALLPQTTGVSISWIATAQGSTSVTSTYWSASADL